MTRTNTNMKHFSTQEMLDISARVLGKARTEFDRISEARGAMSLLERAHEKLERASAQSPDEAEEMNALTMELGQIDLDHDRRVRGIYHILVGLSEVLNDEVLATRYTTLRAKVLPSGLNTTLLRYEEQIETARKSKEAVNAADRELLARVEIPNGQGTLLDQVEAWWTISDRLFAVWQKRQRLRRSSGQITSLSAAQGGGGQVVTAADLLRAKHQWISAMRVLLASLMASPLSEPERAALLPELDGLQ